VSILLIFRSFMTRVGTRTETTEGEILPDEIIRKTTGFEHTQLKNGRVVFRVVSGSSTMKAGGDNVLERVSLWRFDESGDPADMIEGAEAVYNPEKKEIMFTGDVVIRLEQGLLIYADQVYGDLDRQVLVIRENYRIEHDSVVGRGRGLEYGFLARRLSFIDGLEMIMDAATDPREVRAGNGRYFIDSGKILLGENASIESSRESMTGEKIEIDLNTSNQVTGMKAWEKARLMPGSEYMFSGDGISVDFTGNTLTILGSEGERAVYRGGMGSQAGQLSAEAISCSFQSGPDRAWTLDRIKAEGDVRLALPESRIEECRSELFQGIAASGNDGRFESLSMSENVYLVHAGEGGEREILQGRELRLSMDDEGLPLLVEVEDDVLAELVKPLPRGGVSRRSLEVRDILTVRYEGGIIREASGRLGCRLKGSSGEMQDSMEAETINLEFSEGLLSKVSADGNVRGGSLDGGTRRQLSSGHLGLYYREGVLFAFEQLGNAVIREGEGGRTLELRAEKNYYDVSTRLLEAEGGRPFMVVEDRGANGAGRVETRARTLSVNRGENRLTAAGDVESIYYLEDGTLVFLSSSMRGSLEGGSVEYSGSVRMLLDEHVIKGDKMLLDAESGALSVEGNVDTRLLTSAGGVPAEYRIVSRELDLDTEAGTATYRDDVRLDSDDLSIEAPFLVLYTEAGRMKELSRIEAWGGVRIVEEGRTWTGERAVYLRETGRVTVDKD